MKRCVKAPVVRQTKRKAKAKRKNFFIRDDLNYGESSDWYTRLNGESNNKINLTEKILNTQEHLNLFRGLVKNPNLYASKLFSIQKSLDDKLIQIVSVFDAGKDEQG